MKTGILFDLDGTLWDTCQKVTDAWNAVLAEKMPELKFRTTVEFIKSHMGWLIKDIALDAFKERPGKEQEIMAICLQAEHDVLITEGGILYPELERVLAELREKYFIAVVSNCNGQYLETFFEAHKMDRFFHDRECAGNTGCTKAENIGIVARRNDLDKVIYVGDTALDCSSADEAGVEFIHAAYGFGKPGRPCNAVSCPAELPAMIEKVLGEKG